MRIFAAVVPPDDALTDLGEFLDPRRDAGPELRWTDPSLWHITLAFMADVPERRLDEVALAVADDSQFPLALVAVVIGFVAVQGRLDRRDPKLALAPVRHDLSGFPDFPESPRRAPS